MARKTVVASSPIGYELNMQTIEAGSVAAIVVNVTDENGDHVAAVIDTTTTRLQKGNAADTTWDSAAPTVDTIATGVYRIKWTGLSPEVQLTHNDDGVRAKINGTIAGVAWSEYHLPLRVVSSTPRAVIRGAVETGTTAASGTAFSTNWTTDEPVEGRTLVFTSGANEHLAVKITAAALVSGELNFTVETESGGAMPNTPADGDTWEIV